MIICEEAAAMDTARHESAEDFSRLNSCALYGPGLHAHSRVLFCTFMTGRLLRSGGAPLGIGQDSPHLYFHHLGQFQFLFQIVGIKGRKRRPFLCHAHLCHGLRPVPGRRHARKVYPYVSFVAPMAIGTQTPQDPCHDGRPAGIAGTGNHGSAKRHVPTGVCDGRLAGVPGPPLASSTVLGGPSRGGGH